MNTERDSKTVAIKTLAIVGFFATIALLLWILVQAARFAPETFSSLASMLESMQNYRPVEELTIATEKSIVNSGESFKLSWTDMERAGTYDFGYMCTEGVSLEVRGAEGDLLTIPCTETLSLPEDVHGLFVSVSSERSRFADVPLLITFKEENGEAVTSKEARVTVVNATISIAQEKETETVAQAPTPEPKPEVVPPAPAPAPKPVVPQTPPQTAAAITATPQVTETTVSYIPVSNPNGFTDLKVSFVGVGIMDGNTFVPSASYDPDKRGGLKFEVKNIGTKTSGSWDFTATLPEGFTYKADTQAPLKPNERAIFTLGFTMDEDTKEKSVKLGITVSEKSDTNKANNSFTQTVQIKD